MATVYLRDVKGRLHPVNSALVARVFKEEGFPTTVIFHNGTKFESSDDFETVNEHLEAGDRQDDEERTEC